MLLYICNEDVLEVAADGTAPAVNGGVIFSLLVLLCSLFILIVKLMIVDLAVLRSVYI